ncbi:shikimate dehydrogenase [Agrococcus terreus]|uniref:shikimate dehydrogenase family protein n=1 Tax=Agrococcus terreus TaxID=574649 RepID=UPI003850F873
MPEARPARLAVVGSPIAHSKSPAIQAAAAAALGVDWDYGRAEVPAGGLAAFVAGLGAGWRGLSVTAPLKEEAAALAATLDERARATGGANTLLLGPRIRGWNTDVGGIVHAFRESGLDGARTAAIVGAGATALSALVALAELGAREVAVALRTPAKGERLVALGAERDVAVALRPLDAALPAVDAAVSTLPAAADAVPRFAAPPARLLDADYARPDGSRFAASLPGGTLVDGLAMLLGQAILQARIFAQGEVDAPLPDEQRVLDAMRAAVSRPAVEGPA